MKAKEDELTQELSNKDSTISSLNSTIVRMEQDKAEDKRKASALDEKLRTVEIKYEMERSKTKELDGLSNQHKKNLEEAKKKIFHLEN